MTCDFMAFQTRSVVRLWQESHTGPLTDKASPNQPTEGFGGPMSHEKGVCAMCVL